MRNLSLEILEVLRDTQELNLSSYEIARELASDKQKTINTLKTLAELGLVYRVRENTKGTNRHESTDCARRFLYTISQNGRNFLSQPRRNNP